VAVWTIYFFLDCFGFVDLLLCCAGVNKVKENEKSRRAPDETVFDREQ
jgi:hypothetical protein